MAIVPGFAVKIKEQEKEGGRKEEKEIRGTKLEEKKRRKEGREGKREIAGLISRLGCLAMDVDTRHLLERAATAGYQSSGSPRS